MQFRQIAQSSKAPSPLTKERSSSLCAYVNMIPAPRRNLWTPLRYVAIPVLPCVHAVTVFLNMLIWCISVEGLSSLPLSVFVLLPCLNLLWTTVHSILRHDQACTPTFSVRALHVQWTYSSLARAVFSILTRCFANLDERCLVQWLNWGFTTQERKKERKERKEKKEKKKEKTCSAGRTPWVYCALSTVVGGNHYDRALRSLVVRETWLLELASPRMRASLQILWTVFTH